MHGSLMVYRRARHDGVRLLVGVAVCVLLLVGATQGQATESAALAGPVTTLDAPSGPVLPRIVGGVGAPEGEWPSIVALLNLSVGDGWNAQFCGGTLIAPRVVLTAAHCVVNSSNVQRLPNTINVAVGPLDLRTITAEQRIAVSAITVHVAYNRIDGHPDDVALLTLAGAATATPMPVISAAQAGLLAPGDVARIAGWGNTAYPGSAYPYFLQQAQVPLVSNDSCFVYYDSVFVAAKMLCAGYNAGGVDTCQGDSGGPITRDVAGTRTLIGVVSFGEGCALVGVPGVYARLSNYLAFILGNSDVTAYLNTQNATPTVISVTNAGSAVTVQWSVPPANWTTSSLASTVNGSTQTESIAVRSRVVDVPAGGTVTVGVTTTATLGTAGTGNWSGTPTATRAPDLTASVTGSTAVGGTLSAIASSDDPWSALSYAWTVDGTPVGSGPSLTVLEAFAGRTIRVGVSATNAAGQDTMTLVAGVTPGVSAPTPITTPSPTVIGPRAQAPAGGLRVTGTPRVGATLRVRPPVATGTPAPRVTYQWQRNGRAIAGARAATYRTRTADAGQRLRCRILYTNTAGSQALLTTAVRVRS